MTASRSNVNRQLMKTLNLLVLVLLTLTLNTGCVVSIGGRSHAPVPPAPPPAPPPVVVTNPADAATVAEIDAAAQLNMDSARTQALSQIAGRPSLGVPVQVHLINVTYRCLNFESSKMQVLQQIIARPDFSDGTRHAIVSQLNSLSFDSNRQAILGQINSRLAAGPAS